MIEIDPLSRVEHCRRMLDAWGTLGGRPQVMTGPRGQSRQMISLRRFLIQKPLKA